MDLVRDWWANLQTCSCLPVCLAKLFITPTSHQAWCPKVGQRFAKSNAWGLRMRLVRSAMASTSFRQVRKIGCHEIFWHSPSWTTNTTALHPYNSIVLSLQRCRSGFIFHSITDTDYTSKNRSSISIESKCIQVLPCLRRLYPWLSCWPTDRLWNNLLSILGSPR